ncbi:glucose inhibited division protein A [Melghirimyces profundicolus]|uniref:Glucose inhibited division protein A n=1 Tax=Melghirimyces profundicolus TaxID=1242148 RepID=A0A2T6C258_9BACL|nr:FAD-dependent oxidoreductase [Melghirimyces profundicolus]PTX62414.1 glucose inhibited division protein A [Melghirimyces profundicolus]
MAHSGEEYDVIIISKGPAGREAAKKAARMGKTALLLKLNPGSVASVMCSSSQQGSSQGPREGVEAQLIRLEENNDWSPKLLYERVKAETQHSVYILQAQEQSEKSNLLFKETEEAPQSDQVPDPRLSFESGSSPMLKPKGKGTETPPSQQGKWTESGEEFPSGEPTEKKEGAEPAPPEPAPQDDHPDPVPGERETSTREKKSHPPFHQTERKSSSEPVFREREKRLRKKLARNRHSTPASPTEPIHQPSSPDRSTEPAVRKEPPSSVAEPPTKKGSNNIRSRRQPDDETRSPLESGPLSGKTPPGKHPALSVIPMEQKMKRRKFSRQRDLLQGQDRKNTSHPEKEPDIPGHRVWDSKERKDHTPDSRKEESPNRPQQLTYEPFQGNKNRPASGKGWNREFIDSNQANFRRREGDSSQRGPLQGRRRKTEESASLPFARHQRTTEDDTSSDFAPSFKQEAARNVLKNSGQSDALKKDDISIEDPFGQSYDEFLGPFSTENSQDEQLEKRKLALRGLHNLINNLG